MITSHTAAGLHLPVFTVVPCEGGLAGVPVRPHATGVGVGIYTDNSEALRAIELIPDSETYRSMPLNTPLAFLGFLLFLRYKGIDYVIVNDGGPHGSTDSVGSYITATLQVLDR